MTVRAEFPLDDAAFLQVSGGNLDSIVPEIPSHEVDRSTLIIVPVPGQAASEIGVVGTERLLRIERDPGVLPLELEQSPSGLRVTKAPGPGADQTSLTVQLGDLVTHLDGTATPTLEIYESIFAKQTVTAGDPVRVTLRRDDRELTGIVHADSRSAAYRIHQYSYAHVSLRRTGFESVLSHDAIVSRANCGGPVVDCHGRIVGINIARLQRCSTLALPASRILELLAQMRAAAADK